MSAKVDRNEYAGESTARHRRRASAGIARMALASVLALVALGACSTAAAPVEPTVVPAPAPAEPTPTPAVALATSLDQIEGWWKSTLSMDGIMHVESDGTWTERGITTEIGPIVERGAWKPSGQRWELHRQYGPMDAACIRTVGQYEIQIVSEAQRRAILVEDDSPCAHEDVVWTRASEFEALLGTWAAEGQSDATVAFRSDLTYAAWKGPSPEEGRVCWGQLVWNQPLHQIEVKDHAASPCGPSLWGKYKVAVSPDGKATITCVEDPCEERRQVMTQWGPFHADDALSAVAGRWVGKDQPRYELLLTTCGCQRMRLVPDEGDGLQREGTFSIEGSRLIFSDLHGDGRCRDGAGEYQYVLDGDILTLEPVADPCSTRGDFLGACTSWIKADGT